MSNEVLENYISLVATFTEFLTVAIHTILYERNIYPKESFISARKYNYPVKQNRHPLVCKWIDDAVAAVRSEMLKCTVASTSLILLSPTQVPLERYVFSTTSFPTVAHNELYVPFSYPTTTTSNPNPAPQHPPPSPSAPKPKPKHTPLSTLHPQYTAVLARLSTLSSLLTPLPQPSLSPSSTQCDSQPSSALALDPDLDPASQAGLTWDDDGDGACTFTLAIEIRDRPQGVPPVGWPMPWIPSQPSLQGTPLSWPDEGEGDSLEGGAGGGAGERWVNILEAAGEGEGEKKREWGRDIGGAKVRPVRNVEAGPFCMEVWLEEGRGKFFGEEGMGEGPKREGKGKGKEVYRATVEDESAESDEDLHMNTGW